MRPRAGGAQLAWLIPGAGGDVGKAVAAALNVGYALCSAGIIGTGGAGTVACAAFSLYELANQIYGLLNGIFDWGGAPVFKGSLLPRPGVPGLQGNSSFGVPVLNFAVPGLSGY